MAEDEKWPKSEWKRLRPPTGAQGEKSLSRALNRRKSATPSVAALGAGGAARSAAPPARSAETSGSRTSADFRARD
eukprot:1189104-Alexandrium_andersonii.AAC.1